MALPNTQYLASRELDYVCDLRISISNVDYVDSDPWGRKQLRGPHFPTRVAAERQLKALLPKLPPQTPDSVNYAARRALRNSRIDKQAKARASRQPLNPYPQPPQPPSHLKIRDNSRELPPKHPNHHVNHKRTIPKPAKKDLPVPPPGPPPPPAGYPSPLNATDNSSSVFSSETTSFPSSRGRSPPGSRRPRGHGTSTSSNDAKRLSEYLDSNDVGVVRVDEDDEPLSATGAGSVASVPQSPFNSNRMKRWIGKRTGSRPSSPPGQVVNTRKGPQKAKDVRSLIEPNSGNMETHGEFSPANSRTLEPLSMGSYEDETPPAAGLYEMVTLKTSIPDRPRESDLMEDDMEYFDDVGDVALGDDEEAYEEDEEEEEEDLDDYNENGREKSDVTHSFEKPNNLQVSSPMGRRRAAPAFS